MGKKGRAWQRNKPEEEDKGQPPQCFVCSRSLREHTRVKGEPLGFCVIPLKEPERFCEESQLRSKWARSMNKLYKKMAQDTQDLNQRIERFNAR